MKTTKHTGRIGFTHILILLTSLLFSGALFAANAGCNTNAWLGGAFGAVNANSPIGSVSRASGRCGLELNGSGYVQDDSPGAETSFIGNFYFFPQLTGSGSIDLFVAYSDTGASTELFAIAYDGANITIDATANGGGSATVAANPNMWNVVEFSWLDSANGSIWVNSDATTEAADATYASGAGGGVVEAVRLGAPNGLGGFAGEVTVDQYTSNRTQPVGMLLMGDANGADGINVVDVIGVRSEILGNGLQSGQPDCNLDGAINIVDVICVRSIILN